MYSFVMRSESLPKSYQDFIQKTGPVAKPVYKAVRDCCRGGPVDVASISAYLSSRGKLNVMKLEEFPSIIPCSIIHPETDSCLGHNAKAASATFRKTFPLYFSLTFVPFVVLHLQKGPERKTPLHCAAIKGRVDVVSEMLSAYGECAGDVTVQRETVLHLAVKNNQFEVVRVLVDWIRDVKKENILNVKDKQGNTVLHLAIWKRECQAS